jgi:hypothetical protein
MCVRPLILALTSASLAAGAAEAQCDPALLQAASGPVPYRSVKGGYCEGSYSVEVGAPFQVVSFTIGDIHYDSSLSDLLVQAPLSPAGASLAIRARATAGTFGYQMDAQITPPGSFRWATDIALKPLHFHRGDFGVYGRRVSANGEVLVPVMVGSGNPNGAMLLRVVVPIHLTGPVQYAVTRQGGVPDWHLVTNGNPNKGDVLDVILPAGSVNSPANLRIRAKSRSLPVRDVVFDRDISR